MFDLTLQLDCAGRLLVLDRPRVMGIVNVTPDSFSDGGAHDSVEAAVAHGLRLQRIVNAESYRFPEIFDQSFEQGTRPTLQYLADLLKRHAAKGQVRIEDADIAAAVFLSMVIGGPIRTAVHGRPIHIAMQRAGEARR